VSERWEVDVCGYIIAGPGGELALPKGIAKDIAARLNGPSPAEVAALLRSAEWQGADSCGSYVCSACGAYRDERFVRRPGVHADDCKLGAMIKQCEGA
jgi:hypothetical protein